ncbi:hypothetical protein K523DRAFT_335492 [Schizophyllum commune Tattone D]|nr:hypothetical protein K523DRAFT_335492 [Schizophyllum commune Tattone D]
MASDNSTPSGSAQGGEKRKWQTGIMKVWVGTDPTTAAPEIQHRDPKAAVRAEHRKRRKVEPPKPRPKATFRVIAPAMERHAHPSFEKPSASVPVINTKGLISMPVESEDCGGESADYATNNGGGQGRGLDAAYDRNAASAGYSDCLHDSTSFAEKMESPCAFPADTSNAESASHGAIGVRAGTTATGNRGSDDFGARRGASMEYAIANNIGNPAARAGFALREDRAHPGSQPNGWHRRRRQYRWACTTFAYISKPLLTIVPRLTELMRTVDLGASTKDDFNFGWRRFGPKGRSLATYSPQFKGVPLVEWKSGLTTDQLYVETAASRLDDSRMRPDLCLHVKFTSEDEAADLIRECMAAGKPLVFDDFPASLRWAHSCDDVDDDPMMKPIAWSQHATKGSVGANLITPRDFQDAAVRELNMASPYVTATLLDFEAWIRTPGKIGCILDLSCGFRQADEITDHIADNVVECMTNSFSNQYAGKYTIVGDMMKTQDWFLLHTSGFLTFGHIDASGMATSAQIRGGGLKTPQGTTYVDLLAYIDVCD